jgi:hypothetical protein
MFNSNNGKSPKVVSDAMSTPVDSSSTLNKNLINLQIRPENNFATKKTKQTMRVHARPDTASPTIGLISKDAEIKISITENDASKNWVQVQTAKVRGWSTLDAFKTRPHMTVF